MSKTEKALLSGNEQDAHVCVFCSIVEGRETASIITRNEDEGVISFMDLQGYPLVTLLDHVGSNNEDLVRHAEAINAAASTAFSLVPYVRELFGVEGVNILANLGTDAGQEVPHLHIHVMPREKKDNAIRIRRLPSISRPELDQRAAFLRQRLIVDSTGKSE